jgi:Tol biopolymer transport system component
MNTDGSDQLGLSNHLFDDVWPSWGPEGERIAWAWRSGLDGHVYVINVDGAGERRINDVRLPVMTPSWSPNGRRVVFASSGLQIYAVEIDTGEVVRLTGE